MEGKMKTAVMLGIGKMGFEERDIPKAKDDEVLVKLEYVGICGSDLHYYETGAIFIIMRRERSVIMLSSRPLCSDMSRAARWWKSGRMSRI